MKPRTVQLFIEIEDTTESVAALKLRAKVAFHGAVQVQANVVKPTKKK